jgi:hypothetical protein
MALAADWVGSSPDWELGWELDDGLNIARPRINFPY